MINQILVGKIKLNIVFFIKRYNFFIKKIGVFYEYERKTDKKQRFCNK